MSRSRSLMAWWPQMRRGREEVGVSERMRGCIDPGDPPAGSPCPLEDEDSWRTRGARRKPGPSERSALVLTLGRGYGQSRGRVERPAEENEAQR
jgi:hypothetical protein